MKRKTGKAKRLKVLDEIIRLKRYNEDLTEELKQKTELLAQLKKELAALPPDKDKEHADLPPAESESST